MQSIKSGRHLNRTEPLMEGQTVAVSLTNLQATRVGHEHEGAGIPVCDRMTREGQMLFPGFSLAQGEGKPGSTSEGH